MTKNTSLESSCALLFRICQKNLQISKNLNLFAKSNHKVKMKCLQKYCPKSEKINIFEKPLTMPFQICKNLCKILNSLMCNFFIIFGYLGKVRKFQQPQTNTFSVM